MKNSHIEWTDHTFNPWIGCTKVSPGCQHCYAETLNKRWKGGANWGKGAPRQRTSAANWRQPLKWNDRSICMSCGVATTRPEAPYNCPDCHATLRRPRVFCASLADWLDDEVPIEWLCNLLETIHACQYLDWQLLTKRPQNWQIRIEQVLVFANKNDNRASRDAGRHDDFFHWLNLWLNAHQPPDNVWIGTTVEDQQRADERIPKLLEIPAKLRFLSCEPLLGGLNLVSDVQQRGPHYKTITSKEWLLGIHWVICGGESGPGSRPMHPDWARGLRDQCQAAAVPFLFKQWGEWGRSPDFVAHKGDKVVYIHESGTIREECPSQTEGWASMRRVGKKTSGRELDGREWNEFPIVEASA